jgi:hypothetical protein
MPISPVRWVTEYAITPYKPTHASSSASPLKKLHSRMISRSAASD